jgi:hypothetical protein
MRQARQALGLAYGLATAALTLLAVTAMTVWMLLGGADSVVAGTTILFSLTALGCGLGLALAGSSWLALQDRPALRLGMPSPWLLTVLFFLVLAAGELLRQNALTAILLPPLHVLASLLPPLILISAVSGSLQRAGLVLTWRDLIFQMSYGALVATVMAITLEGVASLTAITSATSVVGLLPGGQDALQSVQLSLNMALVHGDPMAAIDDLIRPAFLLAAGLVIAVLVPLIEEVSKSLGMVWVGSGRQHFLRAQAFTWGVMAGAGFSLTEALFNGAAQLPNAWAGPVLLRASTVLIHGLATGLMALGWYEVLSGRFRHFLPYGLASLGLHGAWNAFGVLAAIVGVRAFEGSSIDTLAVTGTIGLAGAMLALTYSLALVGTLWLTRMLASEPGSLGQAQSDQIKTDHGSGFP